MIKLADMLNYSIKSLTHSSLRTWLTIIGIVIGISSVIVLVSIGQGLNESINAQLSQFGTHTIIVTPVNLQGVNGFTGMRTNGRLTTNDFEDVKKVASVDMITPVLSQRATISFKGKDITSMVSGIRPIEYFQIFTSFEIEEGRQLTDSDRNSVVLGNDIAATGFGKEPVRVNSNIFINGKSFRVVGILKKTGNSFGPGDSLIEINYEDARNLFTSVDEKEVSAIALRVQEGADTQEVANEISDRLRSLHRVREGEEDFGLVTPKYINDTVGSITSLLTVFLGAIAAISLIVGGVGIMNTMFMSVVERTKEIGTLKAIGARQIEILSIFLIESGIIGGVGGIIGLTLAFLILLVLQNFGVPVFIAWYVVAGAFVFSFMVGIASGFIPARNAAKISPLEALRYE